MRRTTRMLFIVALALGLVSIARAQQTITPEDAAKFIGQQKTVCGMVASANHPSLTYTEDLTEQPTFLNFNKPFPNQVFTVTILGGDRGKFEKPPETLYSGKEICVTGMIQSYQGRPEIIVKDPSQIKVK